MRTILVGLVFATSLVTACTGGDSGTGNPTGDTPLTPQAPLPLATGIYAGSYRVPTSTSLADAATFKMDSIDWTVAGGIATLHYNLPRGLVGGTLPVTLSGPVDATSTTITLTGTDGTGACVATATTITCREVFGDLGVLPISMDVVQQVAAKEYAGPVANRVNVATVFSSDPIGFAELDLTAPVVVDDGSGHGSGGL